MKNASRIIVLVTLLNLGASICSARTNAKDSSASISGRVTIAGKAAADISVTASIVSGYERRGIAKATTDEDGNYRLSGLSPGRLFVTPVAKAHVISAGEFTRGQPGRNGGEAFAVRSNSQVESFPKAHCFGYCSRGSRTACVPSGVISKLIRAAASAQRIFRPGPMNSL